MVLSLQTNVQDCFVSVPLAGLLVIACGSALAVPLGLPGSVSDTSRGVSEHVCPAGSCLGPKPGLCFLLVPLFRLHKETCAVF